jgi:Tfp pilus assembly protein PilZ
MRIREEHRKHARHEVRNMQGSILAATDVGVLNMSLGGAAIEANRRLEPGSEYTLRLTDGGEAIELNGVIVWTFVTWENAEKVKCHKCKAGMKFTNVLSDRASRLVDFISAHKEAEEVRLSGVRLSIEALYNAVLKYPYSYSVEKISLGGVLIEGENALNPGEKVPMIISLEDRQVRFSGRVIHCEKAYVGGTKYDIGIEFVDMTAEDKEILRKFIQSLGEKEFTESISEIRKRLSH